MVTESSKSEQRCADLIDQARRLGPLGGCVIAHPDLYTNDEVRVARESIQRERGDRFSVVRGTLVVDGEVTNGDLSGTTGRFRTTRASFGPLRAERA